MKSGTYVVLVVKESDGTVKTNPKEPASLTSRVTIKNNATFVIRNFTNSDSTKYRCELIPTVGVEKLTDPVEIVVSGRYSIPALASYPYAWKQGGDLHIEIITINAERNYWNGTFRVGGTIAIPALCSQAAQIFLDSLPSLIKIVIKSMCIYE